MENRVREMRAELGLSQGELGERIGVSRQAINAIERGKHDPSLALAFKLASVFGRRIEEVFRPDA
ncbi:helix-turn-helix transcriptional regulator [Parvularcula maris]|nr:helix-turn-helix transcriptional regulator [Parvularcula maris]